MNPYSNLGASTRMSKTLRPPPADENDDDGDDDNVQDDDDDDEADHVEDVPSSDGVVVPQDAHCVVDPKSGLAALLQVVANTCESHERENVNRTTRLVHLPDSAVSNHKHHQYHEYQQQQQQQFADVTDTTTSAMNGPLHVEAVGELKHGGDDKKIVYGDVHSSFSANEGLKVRIDPKTISSAGLPTNSTEPATITPDGLLHNEKNEQEHRPASDSKQYDQRRSNAATKSEYKSGIRGEYSDRPANHNPLAIAASMQSNLKESPVRDVTDATTPTSTHQQRTAPSREPISRGGGPTKSNDYHAITPSETRRTTNNPDGDLSQYNRSEMLRPALDSSRVESAARHAPLQPSQVASFQVEQQEEEKVNIVHVNLNAQLLRPRVAGSNAEVEEEEHDDEEDIGNLAQHPESAAAAAASESDDGHELEVMVPEPRPTDILLGRGPACYGHQGNQRFRMLIHRHRHLYRNQAPRREKAMLVHGLVSLILQDGGRFLQERSGMWYEVSPQIARKKVGHALRDARLRQQELDQHRVAESRRRSSSNNNNL
ncbi:hypothetical protein MHU86_9500 [Fragilaria crotonensis]|nr:hypothetical protein MHU86_9500 [Fragilaria crotonensis]